MGPTGSLYGTVTNQSGSSLPGATIMLTGAFGPPEIQVSNAQGSFKFLSLTPGSYSVEAQLEGFQTSTEPNIPIEEGENKNIDLTLYPV